MTFLSLAFPFYVRCILWLDVLICRLEVFQVWKMELYLCLISKGYVCSGLQFEQLHFKTISYLIVFQHLTIILWRGYVRRQIFNERQKTHLLCMFMSVNIWCNLASTRLSSNYVPMKLRDDARNSNNDKLFQVHHPKSRNLGAVIVHFLLSTQISPVNCKGGSEERVCHPLTQLKCGHSLQEPVRDVCVDTDAFPRPFELCTS